MPLLCVQVGQKSLHRRDHRVPTGLTSVHKPPGFPALPQMEDNFRKCLAFLGLPAWIFISAPDTAACWAVPQRPQRVGSSHPRAGQPLSLCPAPSLSGTHSTLAGFTHATVKMPPEPSLFPGKPLAGKKCTMKTQRPLGKGDIPEFTSLLATLQTSAPRKSVPETTYSPSCSLNMALGPAMGPNPPAEGFLFPT